MGTFRGPELDRGRILTRPEFPIAGVSATSRAKANTEPAAPADIETDVMVVGSGAAGSYLASPAVAMDRRVETR